MALAANKILAGHKGEFLDDKGNLLAFIPEFKSNVSVKNTEYQPAGSAQSISVFTGYSVDLQFTETVVQDVTLLKTFLDKIKAGEQLFLNFQGKIKGTGTEEERIVYTDCTPDGTIDLQGIQPGDIIKRQWSWKVNGVPDLQKHLADK